MTNEPQRDPRADAETSEQARLDRINAVITWNKLKAAARAHHIELVTVGDNAADVTPSPDEITEDDDGKA
jgi:hypothetical protein